MQWQYRQKKTNRKTILGCLSSCHSAQWLQAFHFPQDLLNSQMKRFSEPTTWGKKGEAFVYLHLSPIVEFPALQVCVSLSTETLPTGSTLRIQRNPNTRSKRESSLSTQGTVPLVASAQSSSQLAQLVTVEQEIDRQGQEDLEENIREVHFQGLVHLPIFSVRPYF